MKATLIIVLLVTGMSLQVAAMGHPHNLFAAHKQIKAKRTAISNMPRTDCMRSKTALYAKSTVVTTAAFWTWFSQKSAK